MSAEKTIAAIDENARQALMLSQRIAEEFYKEKKRKPLTEDEIRDLFTTDYAFDRLEKIIRIIERAHGIT